MISQVPVAIRECLALLNQAGYEAYLIGGCVRDLIMNLTPHDYDITTNALPKQIKQCFSDYKQSDQGIKHGTILVLMDDYPVEITTYRIDQETLDHRHPSSVQFTTSLLLDCQRRDFTINAFALSLKDERFDFFDGNFDLDHKIIRCILDPNERFQEDALRILRALRFATRFGFEIELHTKEAMFIHKALLKHLSSERIYVELSEILCNPKFAEVFLEYESIFEIIFPELNGLSQHPFQLQKTYELLRKTPNTLTQCLATLFYAYPVIEGKDNQVFLIAKTLKKLTVPALIIKQVSAVIKYSEYPLDNLISIKKLCALLDCDLVRQVLLFQSAITSKSYVKLLDSILMDDSVYSLKQLAFKGEDCLKLSIEPQMIGGLLNTLLMNVIEGKVSNTYSELESAAQMWIKQLSKNS